VPGLQPRAGEQCIDAATMRPDLQAPAAGQRFNAAATRDPFNGVSRPNTREVARGPSEGLTDPGNRLAK
jgi:hypothetical protein